MTAAVENRRQVNVREAVERLRAAGARLKQKTQMMEVCGTHTVNAFRCGLHSIMPEKLSLLSGPGCPVCVTSQGDIELFMTAAKIKDVTLCTYGDMMRVSGATGSLQDVRGDGADVRIVYSAADAVRIAQREPERQVIFAAVGFETTTPATAAAILAAQRANLKNFSVMASHKLVIPAMRALLDGGDVNVQGFLCPGHVAVILGADIFVQIVRDYRMPCVIAGFEDIQIAAGLAHLAEQVADGRAELQNDYPQAVTPAGNPVARKLIEQVFEPADVNWRGLGKLAQSGLMIRREFAEYDALRRFSLVAQDIPEPAGCRCGEVITGKCTPAECGLFGNVCNPVHAVGPCMVSSEGTCQAWFKYGRRTEGRRCDAETRGRGDT